MAQSVVQHGVITRAQLLDAGLTRHGIAHRLQRGRLYRVHRGVYAVGHPRLSREGRWMAAVLACGPGAALSHLTAAKLWGIWERAEPASTHVSVPGAGGRSGPRGVVLHRTNLAPLDVARREGISVTSLPRTLIDIAGTLNTNQRRSVLRQSERQHRLDLPALRASLDALPATSRNAARLSRALNAYVPGTAETEADAEAAFLEICADHGLPAPVCQAEIGPYRPDFLWPELNLVVEIDDRQSHQGHIAFQEDRVRDRAMKAAGFDVLRFTRHEVLHAPDRVAREIAAALSARARPRRQLRP